MNIDQIFNQFSSYLKSSILLPLSKNVVEPISEKIIEPFIQRFIEPLRQMLSCLWSVLPYTWASIVSLLLLYGMFWVMDQGQDVMVQLSAKFWSKSSLLFFSGTLILAFFNWYFSLKNIRKRYKDTPEENFDFDKDLLFVFPRILAVSTILICGYSMAYIAEKENRILLFDSMPWMQDNAARLMLAVSLIFFAFGFKWIDQKIKWLQLEKNSKLLNVFLLGLIALVFLPVLSGRLWSADHLIYLASLVTAPISLAAIIFISLKNLKEERLFDKSIVHYFLNILMLLSFGVFVFSNLSTDIAITFGPSVVFICTLIVLVVVFNSLVLKIINFKNRNKQIVVIIIMALLGVSSFFGTDYKYAINTVPTTEDYISNRMNATDYASKWVDNLVDSCNSDMTIYLVASHGGGIRAAYWTNLVLAQYMDDTNGSFYDHIFSLSGASGGMVGEGLFTIQGKNKIKDSYVDDVVELYGDRDFLSPVIAKLFGFDLIRSVWRWWPVNQIPDRHRDLETIFEQRLDSTTRVLAETDYLEFWSDSTKHLPLLISTSTHAQTGGIAVFSPVKLNLAKKSHDLDIYDEVDKLLRSNTQSNEVRSVPYMTAVLQSARFPIVSPPGSLLEGYQFVDAGFRDNIGAGVTLDMLELLINTLKNKGLSRRFKIKILIINSAEGPENERQYSSSSILGSPVSSFLNLRAGYHKTLNYQIAEAVKKYEEDSILVDVIANPLVLSSDNSSVGEDRKHIFPLGWYLSHKAGTTMHELSESVKLYDVDSSFWEMTDHFQGFMSSLELDQSLVEFVRDGCSFQLEHTILLDEELRDEFKNVPEFQGQINSLISDDHAEKLRIAAVSTDYEIDLISTTKEIVDQLEKSQPGGVPNILKVKKDVVKLAAYNYFTQREGDKIKINTTSLKKDNYSISERFSGKLSEEDLKELRGSGFSRQEEKHLSTLQSEYLSKTLLTSRDLTSVKIEDYKGVDKKVSGFFRPKRATKSKSQVIINPTTTKLNYKKVSEAKSKETAKRNKSSTTIVTKSESVAPQIGKEQSYAETQDLSQIEEVYDRSKNDNLVQKDQIIEGTPSKASTYIGTEEHKVAEQMPTFGGCLDEDCTKKAVDSFILRKLKINNRSYFKKKSAKVEMIFTIEKDGSITNIKRGRSTTTCCEKEIYEIIESMNKVDKVKGWIPGKRHGKAAVMSYKVVITLE